VNKDRYGAAVHEAGHVLVAWALGLKTRKAVVGIRGDDSAGEVQIEDARHLPLIDQIAICSAGGDAQRLVGAPTNEMSVFEDMVQIWELIENYPEDEGEVHRDAGYKRLQKLLKLHRAKVELLATALAERSELDQSAIEQLLNSQKEAPAL